MVTEDLYQKKLITTEVYEKYRYRYSRKLVPEEQPEKLTSEEQKEKQKLDEKARTFAILPSRWEIQSFLVNSFSILAGFFLFL